MHMFLLPYIPFLPPIAAHTYIYLMRYRNYVVHKFCGICLYSCLFTLCLGFGVESHTDFKENCPGNPNHILGQWARLNVSICIFKSLRDDLLHG